jgi:hypothetical protein
MILLVIHILSRRYLIPIPSTATFTVAVEFMDQAGVVEFDRRGVGLVGDVVGGTRQSKGIPRLPLSQWLSSLWIKPVLLDSTDEGLCGMEMWVVRLVSRRGSEVELKA